MTNVWIPAKIRRPDKSGKYLVLTETDNLTSLDYNNELDAFNVTLFPDGSDNREFEIGVKAWSEMIDPEKTKEILKDLEPYVKFGRIDPKNTV